MTTSPLHTAPTPSAMFVKSLRICSAKPNAAIMLFCAPTVVTVPVIAKVKADEKVFMVVTAPS